METYGDREAQRGFDIHFQIALHLTFFWFQSHIADPSGSHLRGTLPCLDLSDIKPPMSPAGHQGVKSSELALTLEGGGCMGWFAAHYCTLRSRSLELQGAGRKVSWPLAVGLKARVDFAPYRLTKSELHKLS